MAGLYAHPLGRTYAPSSEQHAMDMHASRTFLWWAGVDKIVLPALSDFRHQWSCFRRTPPPPPRSPVFRVLSTPIVCLRRAPSPVWEAPPPPPPLCDIPSGCCAFTGPWTVTRSSLRMLRRVAAFCRLLRPVLLLVSFPRSRSPVVGVLGLCWMGRAVPFARQRRPVVGVLGVVLVVAGVRPSPSRGPKLVRCAAMHLASAALASRPRCRQFQAAAQTVCNASLLYQSIAHSARRIAHILGSCLRSAVSSFDKEYLSGAGRTRGCGGPRPAQQCR